MYKNIILFGGSFNPIHNGHIQLLTSAQATIGNAAVFLIPAGRPPHKVLSPGASNADRLEMCRLAVEDLPNVSVSDIESKTAGVCYTVDTVRATAATYPGASLFLLMGADTFLSFHTWKDYQLLASLITLTVYPRNNEDSAALASYQSAHAFPRLLFLEGSLSPAASSDIRSAVAQGQTNNLPLPKRVLAYILKNGLYASKKGRNAYGSR